MNNCRQGLTVLADQKSLKDRKGLEQTVSASQTFLDEARYNAALFSQLAVNQQRADNCTSALVRTWDNDLLAARLGRFEVGSLVRRHLCICRKSRQRLVCGKMA